MKKARSVAHKMINRAQDQRKCQYDKKAEDSAIQEGKIIMLKVEQRYRLDRAFGGSYRVQSTTQTNANVRPVSDPTGEKVDVSLQRFQKAIIASCMLRLVWVMEGQRS